MIKRTAFKHGWWYHYCVHNDKCIELDKRFPQLNSYLHSVFESCPHDYFLNGSRGSKLKFHLPSLNIEHKQDSPISVLTKHALEINAERYKQDHLKVQMFMLENDRNTFAIELPVWLMPEEFGIFSKNFDNNYPLTGHIDLLQIKGDKICVLDYKPSASREKYAATQIYFYALMLSKRTGIPIENFMCGWFDSFNAYTFRPEMKNLENY